MKLKKNYFHDVRKECRAAWRDEISLKRDHDLLGAREILESRLPVMNFMKSERFLMYTRTGHVNCACTRTARCESHFFNCRQAC